MSVVGCVARAQVPVQEGPEAAAGLTPVTASATVSAPGDTSLLLVRLSDEELVKRNRAIQVSRSATVAHAEGEARRLALERYTERVQEVLRQRNGVRAGRIESAVATQAAADAAAAVSSSQKVARATARAAIQASAALKTEVRASTLAAENVRRASCTLGSEEEWAQGGLHQQHVSDLEVGKLLNIADAVRAKAAADADAQKSADAKAAADAQKSPDAADAAAAPVEVAAGAVEEQDLWDLELEVGLGDEEAEEHMEKECAHSRNLVHETPFNDPPGAANATASGSSRPAVVVA